MSENPSEKLFPQRGRGGWGYFPDENTAVLEGNYGAKLLVSGGSSNGGTTPQGTLILRQGELQLVWKRAGSTSHPQPAGYVMEDARYRQIGDPTQGFDTTLEWTITIVNSGALGSGPNGKGWYFYPAQEFLKPDFDLGSGQVPGDMQIWVNDGHVDIVGGCKWSRNVGSGIDGILLNKDGGSQPISEDYPRILPNGSKIRVQINYWVPAP